MPNYNISDADFEEELIETANYNISDADFEDEPDEGSEGEEDEE